MNKIKVYNLSDLLNKGLNELEKIDFDNLKDVELYEMYILCKQSIRLAFISFWIIALLGIATVYLQERKNQKHKYWNFKIEFYQQKREKQKLKNRFEIIILTKNNRTANTRYKQFGYQV